MKIQIKSISKALLLCVVSIVIYSCTKNIDNDTESTFDIPEGYGAINFDLVDIQFEEENVGDGKKASARINSHKDNYAENQNKQSLGMSCTVSLEAISSSSNDLKNNLQDKSKNAEVKTKEVASKTRYRVYAYDKTTGQLATSKAYIRGQEKTQGPLLVYGGKEYTIVAYSINSTTEYPAEIENAANINTAIISNGQVEFMFQKQDVKIANNSNNIIKLRFKHQFAQITTIIKLDDITRAYASIRGASGSAYIEPSYSRTKFKVSDGAIRADNSDINRLGSAVSFPFIPFTNLTTYSISSLSPTILNTPSTITNGTFTIEALTIGDVSRRVDIENLNLRPGVKYNLVLTFHVPETTIIGANPHFHFYDKSTPVGSVYTHEVSLENPTFGANIDIWYLDNSFNLEINGEKLFSKELNFEGFPLHHVYFSDNTYYGSSDIPTGNISVIYRINETKPRQEIPVVRLSIDEFGRVSLMGRKRMSQGLRELFIRDEVTINPLAKLNPNGINKLVFSSTRWTITDVQGRIYGIRVK